MKLRKQVPNRRVLIAVSPCIAGSIYFFGWRSLAMLALAAAVGFLCEWLFCRKRNEPVSEAVFVSAALLTLILPPTVGWHVIIVAMVVAIVFAKEVFGGFGRNIFNPAMAGRCFVYVCFAVSMTGQWAPNALELPDAKWYGALDRWTTLAPDRGEAYAITSASPVGRFKSKALTYGEDIKNNPDDESLQAPEPLPVKKLWWGSLAGSLGVTSAMLIIIGGVYLVWTGTANKVTVISVIVSAAVLSQFYNLLGVVQSPDALRALLSGGFLFGAFFMATDPISSPKTNMGRVLYGIIIGSATVSIRAFSVFNGGFMFSLLLGNMFAPSLDILARSYQQRKAAKAQPATEANAQGASS